MLSAPPPSSSSPKQQRFSHAASRRHIPVKSAPLLLLRAAKDHVVASLQITHVSAAACLLGMAGGIIRVWCNRTHGKVLAWQMAVRDGDRLVTRGPYYAVVRHPSYSGWLLMVAGSFMPLASPKSYFVQSSPKDSVAGKVVVLASFACCVFSTAWAGWRIAKEDVVLREAFRAQWETWAR